MPQSCTLLVQACGCAYVNVQGVSPDSNTMFQNSLGKSFKVGHVSQRACSCPCAPAVAWQAPPGAARLEAEETQAACKQHPAPGDTSLASELGQTVDLVEVLATKRRQNKYQVMPMERKLTSASQTHRTVKSQALRCLLLLVQVSGTSS